MNMFSYLRNSFKWSRSKKINVKIITKLLNFDVEADCFDFQILILPTDRAQGHSDICHEYVKNACSPEIELVLVNGKCDVSFTISGALKPLADLEEGEDVIEYSDELLECSKSLFLKPSYNVNTGGIAPIKFKVNSKIIHTVYIRHVPTERNAALRLSASDDDSSIQPFHYLQREDSATFSKSATDPWLRNHGNDQGLNQSRAGTRNRSLQKKRISTDTADSSLSAPKGTSVRENLKFTEGQPNVPPAYDKYKVNEEDDEQYSEADSDQQDVFGQPNVSVPSEYDEYEVYKEDGKQYSEADANHQDLFGQPNIPPEYDKYEVNEEDDEQYSEADSDQQDVLGQPNVSVPSEYDEYEVYKEDGKQCSEADANHQDLFGQPNVPVPFEYDKYEVNEVGDLKYSKVDSDQPDLFGRGSQRGSDCVEVKQTSGASARPLFTTEEENSDKSDLSGSDTESTRSSKEETPVAEGPTEVYSAYKKILSDKSLLMLVRAMDVSQANMLLVCLEVPSETLRQFQRNHPQDVVSANLDGLILWRNQNIQGSADGKAYQKLYKKLLQELNEVHRTDLVNVLKHVLPQNRHLVAEDFRRS